MSLLRNSLLLVVVLVSVSCASSVTRANQTATAERNVVAFVHAAVVPMNEPRILADQTVLIADGRIVEIGPAPAVKVPRSATRIDATGRYLLPAFCDMHVHLEDEAFNAMLKPEAQMASAKIPFETLLFPFVANGVTTIQVLSATPHHVALQRQAGRGEVLVPRLINARMIDGPKKAWPPPLSTWVASAAEADA
ncbi:MAG: hypothetical protein WA208_19695, partial [Thermoanaerobaculia bacterium]